MLLVQVGELRGKVLLRLPVWYTDKNWKGYKRLLSRGLLLICVMTVTVFALIQGFSYTKFSTFYKIIKRRIYQKLHYNLGV